MPVRLDKLPKEAELPEQPHVWFWMVAWPLFVVLLVAGADVLAGRDLLWPSILSTALLVFSPVTIIRMTFYHVPFYRGTRFNEDLEQHRHKLMKIGRRSLDVLGTSLYTGLRQAGDRSDAAQLQAMLSDAKALKRQPSRFGSDVVGYSRLAGIEGSPHSVLLQTLKQVLADLAPTLLQVPATTRLALLLEIDCGLPEDQVQRILASAWAESGILQTTIAVDRTGLDAVDQWLERPMSDQELGLIVAVRLAPQPLEGSAEVALGLLLGNRHKAALPPIACLHRPEQELEANAESLQQAAENALEWAAVSGQKIYRGWRAGVDMRRNACLGQMYSRLSIPLQPGMTLCHLDALLGRAGEASSWLAIAAAIQAAQFEGGWQFVVSGNDHPGGRLWSTVVAPVKLPSLQ